MCVRGWPWMKGCPVAFADPPIPPIDAHDDRPAVKDIIEEHRDLIDKVMGKLQDDPLFDPTKHDDLWIVRFLLSHKKKIKHSVKAAKHTLQFRADLKLDERDMRSIHVGKNTNQLNEASMNYLKYCDDDTIRIVVPDAKRSVVSYLKFSGIDQPSLVAHVSEDDWLPAHAFLTEWSHQWVDYVTRTTGRLTKTIRIVDLENVCLRKNCNLTANKRDGKALAYMEDCYPQLLQSLFLVRAPVWIECPWRMLRPIIPKRVVCKFDFISPDKHLKDRAKLTKYMDLSKLPKRYGGEMMRWPDDTPPPKI